MAVKATVLRLSTQIDGQPGRVICSSMKRDTSHMNSTVVSKLEKLVLSYRLPCLTCTHNEGSEDL